jgi:uncharacterized phage infection (PIP) family protein YhgE
LAEGAIRTTAQAVEGEINRLEGALGQVAERLAQIEGQVERRTLALNEAGQAARGSADSLAQTMEQERQRLDSLLAALAEMTANAANTTQVATEGLDLRANRLTEAAQGLATQSTRASELAIGAAERLDQAAQRAASAISELDQAAAKGESALARAHDLMVLARLRADEAVGSFDGAVQSLNSAAQTASESAMHAANTITGRTQEARNMSLATLEDVRAAAEANARLAAEALRAEAAAARLAGDETMAALRASSEYSGMPRDFTCCVISLRSCSSTFSRSWVFSNRAMRRDMRLFMLIDLPKASKQTPCTITTMATKITT